MAKSAPGICLDFSTAATRPSLQPPSAVALLDVKPHEITSTKSIAITSAPPLSEGLNNILDGYTYPVLTLPNDITSEIFICFLPIYPAAPPLIGLASPTTLTHVCRHWRAVALATPALWRAIQFHPGRTRHPRIRRISDEWIRRAGSCPLSIDILTTDGDFLSEILAGPSTELWEHLQLRHDPRSALPAIGGVPLPLLRGLELSATAHGGRARHPVLDITFLDRNVAQLRAIVLNGPNIPKVTLPWTVDVFDLELRRGRTLHPHSASGNKPRQMLPDPPRRAF
ncbi:hypothetical protein C8R45DRAFT_1110954 [Mycena sanguinolenta]|nr:hypothetical protein C8R45DRAFT_1110954 [Mycena sanguinolenta]